ncbi:hypothetical protein NKH53_31655 [Mesorhizobium australicum]|uniref:hypothetical protein n=1 Tax=Mesorhizobium australicum TaxID=536018 RepID=UPI00333821BD
MGTVHLIPEDIREASEVHEWRNAAGVISTAHPAEWANVTGVPDDSNKPTSAAYANHSTSRLPAVE